jgi:hypothetical protein
MLMNLIYCTHVCEQVCVKGFALTNITVDCAAIGASARRQVPHILEEPALNCERWLQRVHMIYCV